MSQHHHHQFDPKFRRFHGFLMVYHLILSFLRAIRIAFKRMRRGMMRSLLRVWMKLNRQDRYGRAGFVLPTVTMVLLVVVLLSVTIMLRSMDRSKMAQYRRVDEAVLQAATPALDRAKAKIQHLLSPSKPRTLATPSDTELYRALKESSYNLADETQLQVRYAANGTINVNENDNTPLENRTTIATAWKFPVDTDNNGKFDTWTIYGIYFRNPINTNTARNPLDARTPPYTATSNLKSGCQVEGTSSGLVGGGWYPVGSKLQKAIFTYVVNVPIAESEIAGWNTAKYDGAGAEAKATTAISALEYQQDVTRIPLNNNAVVYRDDLELSPGGGPFFRLNGRVMTNSNLMVTQYSGLAFFLVSAPGSCFFEDPENSKIIVGGEVINGVSATASGDSNDVDIHLFQGPYVNPLNPNKTQQITDAGANNRTVTDNSLQVLSNSEAYEARLSYLVSKAPTTLLNEITDPIKRNKALRTYFEDRVRKVPYKEVDFNGSDTMQDPVVSGTVVKPPNTWIYPSNIDNNSGGKNAKVDDTAAFNKLTPTGTTTAEYRMQASNPDGLSIENNLGDRILVGNGLPLKWYINEQEQSGSTPQFLFAGSTPIYWTGTTEPRYRQTRVQELPDVGSTDRDGFWEIAAGTTPKTADDPYGGLRIVTGAGIYSRNNSFLPPPKLDVSSGKVIAGAYQTSTSQTNPIVWPDTMPMSVAEPRIVPPNNTKIGGSKIFDNSGLYDADGLTPLTTLAASTKEAGDGERWKNQDASSPTKGDLQMRATVVYHYAQSSFSQELNQEANSKGEWTNVKQTPIACVSSYYDPSTALTAKNMESLRVDKLDATGNIEKDPTGQVITLPAWNTASKGRSNNGIVYGPPPAEGSYSTALSNQAKLVFPDGRWVNPTLRDALAATTRTLSQQAAVDATLCAYGILDGTLKPLSNPPIPHGAIRETAFLDARQIKATEQDNTTTTNVDETFTIYQENPQTKVAAPTNKTHQLPLEHRQPLEIRATILDIFQLRTQQIAQTTSGPTKAGKEYLLPLSGIVYASRDDALPDSTGADLYASSTDSWVDPTRRPNGIMLINGKCLARDTAGSCNPALTGGNNEEKIQAITREKGLTLVSNLPVYIKGQFNPHTQEEFKTPLAADWGNFYTRSTSAIGKTASTITKADRNLNENFACRPGDPRLPGCTAGDSWRPATILADAVTVLSGSTTTAADTQGTNLNAGFRFGFRNEGDFDLRNNAGVARTGYDLNADGSIKHIANLSSLPATQKQDYDEAAYDLDLNGDGDRTDLVQEYEVTAKAARMINGFDGYNNFVTNGLTSRSKFDTDDNGTVAETYQDSNYTVAGGLNSSYFNNFVTPVQRRSEFPDYVMELCRKPMVSACSPRDWVIGLDVEGVVFKEVTSNGTTPPVSPVVSQTNKIIFDYPTTGPNPAQFTNTDNPTTTGVLPSDLDSYQLAVLLAAGKAKVGTKQIQYNLYDWKENQNSTQQGIFIADKFLAGTTSRPARFVEDQGFPRRISFFRYANGKLLTNSSGQPVSIGMAPKPTGNSSTSNNQDEQHDILSCFVVDGNSLTLDFDTVGADVLRGSDANGNKNANQKQQCSNATPRIRSTGNGLWFRTVASNNSMSFDAQRPLWLYNPATPGTRKVFQTPNGTATRTIQNPLLAPVLQIAMTTGTPASTTTNTNADQGTSWLMIADNGPANNGITPYDLVVGTGDTPSSKINATAASGNYNGGLANLVRLVENWQGKTVKISGSFIQFQRSKYATASFMSAFTSPAPVPPQIFGNGSTIYRSSSTSGRTPYFSQPTRNWGFDIGLLSQSPDLFAQKLTTRPSDSEPAEYFREVGRSDEWVKTLLCAKEADGTTNAVYDGDPNKDDTIRPTSFCKSKTGG